jgi:hypothetical protein
MAKMKKHDIQKFVGSALCCVHSANLLACRWAATRVQKTFRGRLGRRRFHEVKIF